eukprot:12136782-Alexandrium_andersonii.AAC.1
MPKNGHNHVLHITHHIHKQGMAAYQTHGDPFAPRVMRAPAYQSHLIGKIVALKILPGDSPLGNGSLTEVGFNLVHLHRIWATKADQFLNKAPKVPVRPARPIRSWRYFFQNGVTLRQLRSLRYKGPGQGLQPSQYAPHVKANGHAVGDHPQRPRDKQSKGHRQGLSTGGGGRPAKQGHMPAPGPRPGELTRKRWK